MLGKNLTINGMFGGMKLDEYYTNKLEQGLTYQDFVADQLYNVGIVVVPYMSTKYQKHKGESRNGIEIKFDDGMKSGNVYIETQEKSNPSNRNFIPSGIYRDDNSWLYVIGNYELILIFGKRNLQILFEGGRYQEIEIKRATSKGFLLPISFAKERVAIKFIEVQPELQLAGG